jgi:diguanylate cyclase (GGDEF)-like protein/putative nucleotidyltransferase with HDIG domain
MFSNPVRIHWNKMQQLSPLARAYLIGCYFVGMLALGWLLFTSPRPITLEDWLLGGILSVAGALCEGFAVEQKSTSGRRADHLTLAPLFAALLLLPSPVVVLVIIVAFLPDWYFNRRSWVKQTFNIMTFLVSAVAVRLCLMSLIGQDQVENSFSHWSLDSGSILMTVPVFLGVQALLMALVLKLAHGQSFGQSGLFTFRSLLLEAGIICLGLGFAIAWVVSPPYSIAVALPLVLIFDVLHVPNLKELAATDPKTGLANMRHFNQVIERDIERAARSGGELSVLMCDLDYLRNINNTYGHQAGDVVLLGIADIMRRTIRSSDVAARFGGEEFVILLGDTGSNDARNIAERLRSEIEQTRFKMGQHNQSISATVSIGVATYPRHGQTAEILLHEADLAVYQAKQEGRNRVAVAGRTSRELAGEWARENLVPVPSTNPTSIREQQRPFWNSSSRMTQVSDNTQISSTPVVSDAPTSDAGKAGNRGVQVVCSSDPAPRVLAFISAVVAAGLLGIWSGLSFTDVPWEGLALFAAMTIAIEYFGVDISERGTTSVGVIAMLSATFLFGEFGILIAALASAGSLAIKSRSRLHRVLFNFGALLLSAKSAYWIFEALVGESIGNVSLASMLLPAVAAGLMYYAVNHLLLCVVRGLNERRSPFIIWGTEYRWLWPHYAVMGVLGLFIALIFQVFGVLGVGGAMAPVGMMHLAIAQYINRTKVYVAEVERMNEQLSDSYEATLQALSRALDTRDEETEEHSQRVRHYTELIAQRFGVPDDELVDISRGALLHDIGKIGVPDAILLKPGKLTPDEMSLMRKHPEIGYSMIAHIPFLARAAQVVLHHHEAFNGSGYPSGLSGANIPLGARIFAIADTFDAMTSDRPYRKALSVDVALAEIKRCRGTQFDPDIVDTFLEIPIAELMAIRAAVYAPGNLSPVIERSELVKRLVLTEA